MHRHHFSPFPFPLCSEQIIIEFKEITRVEERFEDIFLRGLTAADALFCATTMLATIKETIKKYCLLRPGDRVVIAVSGGPDSVCLLNILHMLRTEMGLSLHIAHLDHMFRGTESAAEASFVAELAEKIGISATIEKFDVPSFCRERGLSAQSGAREVRYEFLSRVALEVKACCIATGHTATDQAETFLLRLLRGAGVSGLSAIPPKRQNIVRPLIEVTREEVLEHLRKHNLGFVSDPSNTKPVYARNRIRLELIPALRQYNPRIIETLAAEAGRLRDEDEAVESVLAALASGMIREADETVAVKREEFNALPLAFRRRLFRKAALLAGLGSSQLSSVQTDEAVAFLAEAQTGRALHLPNGLQLARQYDLFVLAPGKESQSYSYSLPVPGDLDLPDLGFRIETRVLEGERADLTEASVPDNYFWQAQLDYDKIGSGITLRNRIPGDWFCPSGMGGKSKKVQDFFVDAKVPRNRRDRLPVLAAGSHILGITGFRVDERFRARPETKRILVVTFRESAG